VNEGVFEMLDAPNDDIFGEGYCVGVYEVTVDQGPRIRLPRAIVKVLKDHDIEELWRFPDHSGPRLILCPDAQRDYYIERCKKELSTADDPAALYRKFLCPGMPVALKDHGRVSIVSAVRNHMQVVAGDVIVILGVGPWYELWRDEDWIA
jgi:DNA-binding transcriptional regulator/RsmH inhibitor MraZ